MSLNLTRRSIKGEPLTAADHDGNLDKLEQAIEGVELTPGADGADGADGLSVLSGAGAPDAELGVDGEFYIDTVATAIYGPKTAGVWGSPTSLIGADGADGAPGVDGLSVLSGTGAPNSGLGRDGEFYIDTAANEIYGPKAAGAWGTGVSLVGPPGADGLDGAAGTNGADGAPGADGADGLSVLSGSGVPSSGLGVDGEFYIDTDADTIYGPKTAGSWGSPTSLVGPPGAPGADAPDTLGDLTDVDFTTPPGDGEALVYDDDSGNWVPGAAGASAAGAVGDLQFNNGTGGLGASADLNWDDTGKVLDVGGDVNLDDGGSFQTTLQLVTPTAARTITFPDATGTVGLVAGSTGQLVFNNAGAYSGLSGVTTDGTDITLTGRFISSLNGAASAPPGTFTGTWFTGGTATTTKPQVLIEPTGTTSTAWSTAGTGLGVNAASGFAGNLLDLQVNGTSVARFASSGLTLSNNPTITATGLVSFASSGISQGFNFNQSVQALGLVSRSFGTSRNSANGEDVTFFGGDVGFGTDFTGGDCQIRGGRGRGSGNSGAITFGTATGGASGSTRNEVVERFRITPDGRFSAAEGFDFALGTTTGTKIGTATTQKLGFYNATPVVQPAAVTDITTTATAGTLPTPDGSVTVADADAPTNAELLEYCVELEAKLEAALGHLRTLGLIAT
jgi:hypothetical protein